MMAVLGSVENINSYVKSYSSTSVNLPTSISPYTDVISGIPGSSFASNRIKRKGSVGKGKNSVKGRLTSSIGINISTNVIVNAHDHDVLYGRGGNTNHHQGNKRFRDMVKYNKERYYKSPKKDKNKVAMEIVETIRLQKPSGRFLEKDENGFWQDVGDKKAIQKTCQALRDVNPGFIESDNFQPMQVASVKHARPIPSTSFGNNSMPKRQKYNKYNVPIHAAAAQASTPVSSCQTKSSFSPLAKRKISDGNKVKVNPSYAVSTRPIVCTHVPGPQQDPINIQPLFCAVSQPTMAPLAQKEEHQPKENGRSLRSLPSTPTLLVDDGKTRLSPIPFDLNSSNDNFRTPGWLDVSLVSTNSSCQSRNSNNLLHVQQQQQIVGKGKEESSDVPRNLRKKSDLPVTSTEKVAHQQVHQKCIAFDDPDMYKYDYFEISPTSFVDIPLDSALLNMLNSTVTKIDTESRFDVSMAENLPVANCKTPSYDNIFEYETVLDCPNFSDVIPYWSIMDLYI